MSVNPTKAENPHTPKENNSGISTSIVNKLLKITFFILSTPVWLLTLIFKKINRDYLTPIAIIFSAFLIALSIILGSLIISLSQNPTSKINQISQDGKGAGGSSSQSSQNQPSDLTSQPTDNSVKLNSNDKIRDNKSARFVLIEYSDLECPYCKKLHPDLKKITTELGSNIAWVYRHFPIDSSHPKARKEAEAAECAAELGGNKAFWQYLDRVFEITPSNNGLDPAQLPQIANQIGLDGTKLQSCIDSGKMSALVENQFQSGIQAGVNGTPGTFILDTKTGISKLITGAIPYENLKSEINSFIEQSGK